MKQHILNIADFIDFEPNIRIASSTGGENDKSIDARVHMRTGCIIFKIKKEHKIVRETTNFIDAIEAYNQII